MTVSNTNLTPLGARASLNCILQQGLRSIRWLACVAGDPVPENLVRVCRSVEQRRKAAVRFACVVRGAWLGAQQTGRRSDANLLQRA